MVAGLRCALETDEDTALAEKLEYGLGREDGFGGIGGGAVRVR
jgi:hypothetical protein